VVYCVCGFCNVWECVRVNLGFVMFGFVYVWVL